MSPIYKGELFLLSLPLLFCIRQSFVDMKGNPRKNLGTGHNIDIKMALITEVAQLKWRENMVADFNVS